MTPTPEAIALHNVIFDSPVYDKTREIELIQSALSSYANAKLVKVEKVLQGKIDAFDWATEYFSPSKKDFIANTIIENTLEAIRALKDETP